MLERLYGAAFDQVYCIAENTTHLGKCSTLDNIKITSSIDSEVSFGSITLEELKASCAICCHFCAFPAN